MQTPAMARRFGDTWRAQRIHHTTNACRTIRRALDTSRIPNTDEFAEHVTRAWTGTFPFDHFTRDEWRTLFQAIGYRSNGQPAEPPASLTLYRGAPTQHRDGWSWTPDPRWANVHAKYIPGGRVWVARVQAAALLAQVDSREYVVDTDGLQIQPFKAAFIW